MVLSSLQVMDRYVRQPEHSDWPLLTLDAPRPKGESADPDVTMHSYKDCCPEKVSKKCRRLTLSAARTSVISHGTPSSHQSRKSFDKRRSLHSKCSTDCSLGHLGINSFQDWCHKPAAAVVPMEWIRHYEELQDGEGLRIAMDRLADLEAGRMTARLWD